jgi:hypothetical protein
MTARAWASASIAVTSHQFVPLTICTIPGAAAQAQRRIRRKAIVSVCHRDLVGALTVFGDPGTPMSAGVVPSMCRVVEFEAETFGLRDNQ